MLRPDRTLGLFVIADSPDEAEATAKQRWVNEISFTYPGWEWDVSYTALPIKTPAGKSAADDIWQYQEEDTKAAILTVALKLAADQGLLEDQVFRSACLAAGTLSGWPVRLYDTEGLGINRASEVLSMVRGVPNEDGVPVLDLDRLYIVLLPMAES